jgi:ABC-type phosphate/phosphonate transport system substrate-binding protein
MSGQWSKTLSIITILTTFFAVFGALGSPAGERTATVRIGMVKTLFTDLPEPAFLAMMEPFADVVRNQTGVNGEFVPGGDADTLSRNLAEGKIHFGVFHGIEYAWSHAKHPEIRPLVVAVNGRRHLQAYLVVNHSCPAKSLEDLHGATLALPPKSRSHCRLFLERRCKQSNKTSATFFGSVKNSPNAVEAIDDVVDGLAQVAVVDAVALEWFKDHKCGRFSKTRILETSESFPAGVIAYRPGAVDDATLDKFRNGLTTLNKARLGRELLMLWHLSAFEPVPDDYQQTVSDIVKVYPPPAESAK